MQDGWYKIKTWEQIKKEFGTHGINDSCSIINSKCGFSKYMDASLPGNRTIYIIDNHWILRFLDYQTGQECVNHWQISDDIIDRPANRDEILSILSNTKEKPKIESRWWRLMSDALKKNLYIEIAKHIDNIEETETLLVNIYPMSHSRCIFSEFAYHEDEDLFLKAQKVIEDFKR